MSGCLQLMEKLMNYKADQLPGGRYWEPTGEIREIMASLKPHNDNSESVLGMNDWLTMTFPSMHQQTRSTLIEMSTNTKGQPRPITELIQKLKALVSSDSSSTTSTQNHYTNLCHCM